MNGKGYYHEIQRENRRLLLANPKITRKARKLKLSNKGFDQVMQLNDFLKYHQLTIPF